MIDISELDEMVCLLLDRGSLAMCAKASKMWNRIVSPFVWRAIPKDMPAHRWSQFRYIVLEDYLQQISEQEEQNLEDAQRSSKTPQQSSLVNTFVEQPSKPRKTKLLTLDKYRYCVRRVEGFAELVHGLQRSFTGGNASSRTEYLGPSAICLAQHLLRRCPNALVVHFELTHHYIQFRADKKFEAALEVLPKVQSLVVSSTTWEQMCFSVAELEQILAAVSENLHSLTIDIPKFKTPTFNDSFDLAYVSMFGGSFDNADTNLRAPAITARPKTLKLISLGETDGPILDWPWIWRACDQVKDLEINCLPVSALKSIVANFQSMPCVETMVFGCNPGQNGWGPQAWGALLQHSSTLEEVSLGGIIPSPRDLDVLKLCPRLRTFGDIHHMHSFNGPFPKVGFTEFVDFDPERNAIRTWLSKSTLETLAITIGATPAEVPWSQGETTQRLCERLGEFANLRILHLGNSDWGMGHDGDALPLELSLVNGLDTLEGLKNLQEFHICKLSHVGLGVEEVKWMVKSWPRLSKICGLNRLTEAYMWLRETHPTLCLEQPFVFHSSSLISA
ncbi:hypothetical protein BGZ52_004395 [Haplosporangium bisporale]|nr:hypothetical protein BGZ52_004395 [Haplosporangium bisporale]KFH67983.1 hypothetical protein MVEG_06713 [Podila verticillata NRRL 6337]